MTPTWVSRDLAASRNALDGVLRPDSMPDPGIIESKVPAEVFEKLFAAAERPYEGFVNALPGSSEVIIRSAEQVEAFNQYMVNRVIR